jgi:hypothetical protein
MLGFSSLIAKPSMIEEKLFLCGESEMQNLGVLKCLEIKYILVVGKNLEVKFPNVISYLLSTSFTNNSTS